VFFFLFGGGGGGGGGNLFFPESLLLRGVRLPPLFFEESQVPPLPPSFFTTISWKPCTPHFPKKKKISLFFQYRESIALLFHPFPPLRGWNCGFFLKSLLPTREIHDGTLFSLQANNKPFLLSLFPLGNFFGLCFPDRGITRDSSPLFPICGKDLKKGPPLLFLLPFLPLPHAGGRVVLPSTPSSPPLSFKTKEESLFLNTILSRTCTPSPFPPPFPSQLLPAAGSPPFWTKLSALPLRWIPRKRLYFSLPFLLSRPGEERPSFPSLFSPPPSPMTEPGCTPLPLSNAEFFFSLITHLGKEYSFPSHSVSAGNDYISLSSSLLFFLFPLFPPSY